MANTELYLKNYESFLNKIKDSNNNYPIRIFSEKRKIHTFINPYSYKFIKKNYKLFHEFDGIFIDGIYMCIWLKLLYGLKVPRKSFDMTSIARDLFEKLSISGESIFFIGAKSEQIKKSIENIKVNYPKLNILGYRNGYFNSVEERDKVINDIITCNPHFVVVGMGTPLQEQFAIDLKAKGYDGIIFTCGGFLHQTANGIDYYPNWVNKYNLRGFYRQYKEKGIFRRNYDTFILFPILFIKDYLKSKKLK